ncbi:MAG: hypothetical protein H0X30_00350 [Anaerolineae bacterium]|nr:hypothetical protein [Anaerolineae bacterium]
MQQLILLATLLSSFVFILPMVTQNLAPISFEYLNASNVLAAYQTPDRSTCLADNLALHLAISPDGERALAEPADLNEVWLWDVQSGKKLWSYKNIEAVYSNITTLAFSPDGKYFLMSNLDKAIVWDSVTFDQIAVFSRPQRTDRFTHAVFLADSKYILVSGDSRGVQLWEIKSQKLIHSFPGITTAYLSPNEQYILVSQDETSWDLWDIWEGIKLHTFPYTIVPHFTPDSKWVALSDQYIGLLLSSIHNPEITHAILPAGKNPTGWDFSADGKYIITTDESGNYVLIDVETGKTAHTFTDFYPTRWHFDKNSILEIENASLSEMATKIRVWSLNDFSLIKGTTIDTGYVFNAAFTADYRFFLIASGTAEYVLIDLETFQVVARFC